MTRMKRMHVIISGRVQGVSFRAYTRETAVALKLTGWVRNLHAVVSDVDATEEPYTGEFRDFRITY